MHQKDEEDEEIWREEEGEVPRFTPEKSQELLHSIVNMCHELPDDCKYIIISLSANFVSSMHLHKYI